MGILILKNAIFYLIFVLFSDWFTILKIGLSLALYVIIIQAEGR